MPSAAATVPTMWALRPISLSLRWRGSSRSTGVVLNGDEAPPPMLTLQHSALEAAEDTIGSSAEPIHMLLITATCVDLGDVCARGESMSSAEVVASTGSADAPVDVGDGEQNVTPWDVSAGEKGIDYDKLIDQFGSQRIDDALIAKFERVTGAKAHPWIRRGIFFSHRDLDMILDMPALSDRVYPH